MLIVVPAVGVICIVAIPDTVTNAIVMLGMSASTAMTNITINTQSIIAMTVNSSTKDLCQVNGVHLGWHWLLAITITICKCSCN